MCVGKEGPLAHIGAVVGALVLYVPFLDLRHLQNDETKRIFVSAGASAGVAVAFGAPIGGALFVYELSKPNTFWQFKMIWKVFFCCCMSCFTMALLTGLWIKARSKDLMYDWWTGAEVKFGQLESMAPLTIYKMVPAAILIGVISGLMGPLFININTRVNVWRGKVLK
jgi:H+/Cl- antiporter ClcA